MFISTQQIVEDGDWQYGFSLYEASVLISYFLRYYRWPVSIVHVKLFYFQSWNSKLFPTKKERLFWISDGFEIFIPSLKCTQMMPALLWSIEMARYLFVAKVSFGINLAAVKWARHLRRFQSVLRNKRLEQKNGFEISNINWTLN